MRDRKKKRLEILRFGKRRELRGKQKKRRRKEKEVLERKTKGKEGKK